jgi:sulfatase maturation enzyme AslB (radical SAM superfamily)
MPDALFMRIVDDVLAHEHVRHVSLMLQNEPLLDRRLSAFVSSVRERRADVEISIATNGALLTPAVMRRLASAGLTHLAFSLNALTPETFTAVERGLAFETVLANLEELIARPPAGVEVLLRVLVMRSNAVEIMGAPRYGDLLMRARAAGLRCSIEPISNRAGSLAAYESQVVYAEAQSSHLKSFCGDVFGELNVLFNGDVIACCADWERASTYGNLARRTVDEVWLSESARERRRLVLAGAYDRLKPCARCSQAANITTRRQAAAGAGDPRA